MSHRREPALRVEAGRRLVHEQHRGPVEYRSRDHQPLRHATGQRVDRGFGELGELELLEQLVGGRSGLRRADPEQPTVEVEVLPDVQLPVESIGLRDRPDELLHEHRVGHDVDTRHISVSGRRDHPGREHPGRGRLARAVRTEQAEDLAGFHRQVQLVDRLEVGSPVDLGQVDRADDWLVLRMLRSARHPTGAATVIGG